MFFASLALVAMCLTVSVSAFVSGRSFAVQRPAAAALSFLPKAEFNTATTRCLMTSSSDEKTRAIDSPLDRPLLTALDFASILLFALVGTASHAKDGIDLLAVVTVAVPFWISWFLITPFLGLYSDKATSDAMGAFRNATKGWIVAVPLGCVLRGIIKGYVPPIPFLVVTMIATLVMIGGTRVVYTVVNEKLAS
jgi:hypothetical protein